MVRSEPLVSDWWCTIYSRAEGDNMREIKFQWREMAAQTVCLLNSSCVFEVTRGDVAVCLSRKLHQYGNILDLKPWKRCPNWPRASQSIVLCWTFVRQPYVPLKICYFGPVQCLASLIWTFIHQPNPNWQLQVLAQEQATVCHWVPEYKNTTSVLYKDNLQNVSV